MSGDEMILEYDAHRSITDFSIYNTKIMLNLEQNDSDEFINLYNKMAVWVNNPDAILDILRTFIENCVEIENYIHAAFLKNISEYGGGILTKMNK